MAFDLKSFGKTLVYEGTPSGPQLQANFKQIAVQDKKAEKKRTLYFTIAIISAICAFVGFIWAAQETAAGVLLLVPIVLLLVAMVTGVLGGRWNQFAVPDLRYTLPMQLVDMLERDMAKNTAFATRIDFSAPTKKKKQVAKGPWPARSGWTQASFEDPWLRLSGQFLDNTRFALTLTELTVVRSGWKRSRSGKRKHKTKTKPKGMEAQLLLKFSRKRYGAVTALQPDLAGAVNLPQQVSLKKIKVNDHQLLLRAKVAPNSLDADGLYQLFTQMLLSAYQVLNLSKELSKSSA
ncbi:MAG: hypothetical protein AAF703_20725 [Cyanobacteria bacterium P01_D01_bin.105]